MKTAISIPEPLFHAAERLARRLGISRSALFQKAVKEFLGDHEDREVTDALDKVYGSGYAKAKVDRTLERMQTASVAREEW